MTHASIDDYRWLVSPAAEHWLSIAAQANHAPANSVAIAKSLRRELTAPRAALVQEQTALRWRARSKFAAAERMFFTARGLEQSTDDLIARYKTQRVAYAIPSHAAIADLCCGIGGDLASFAANRPATGVDRDPVLALFAAANAGCDTAVVDATTFAVDRFGAWHIDPDRRPTGKRTTQTDLHEPSTAAIDGLHRNNPNAALKLAPAAEMPRPWAEAAELEWIGHSRQCQQLVAWFGALATVPGQRRATILPTRASNDDSPSCEVRPRRTIVGPADVPIGVAPRVLRFIAEPHAAVLAARLYGQLAAEHHLLLIAPSIPYFTTDDLNAAHAIGLLDDAALATFEVVEVLPLQLKKLQSELQRRNVGTLEIKKRGVDIDPEKLRKALALTGLDPHTLIVTPTPAGVRAILCKRLGRDARRA